jgi:hypothetical protein
LHRKLEALKMDIALLIVLAALGFNLAALIRTRRNRLEVKAELVFDLQERESGQITRIILGGSGWLATRQMWIDEYTARAANSAQYYWPNVSPSSLHAQLVVARFG